MQMLRKALPFRAMVALRSDRLRGCFRRTLRLPCFSAFAATLCLVVTAAVPVGALDLDPQLQEIRTLLRERRYPLALESLRLIARQIQELRLETVAPAFPPAPGGWRELPALSLLEEDEIWSSRIHAQRSYSAPGPARMEIVIDVRSPHAAAAALSFNPLAVAGDPRARIADIGGEKALIRFNPDAGEALVTVLPTRDILVKAMGRGIASAEVLVDLLRRVDYRRLRATAP